MKKVLLIISILCTGFIGKLKSQPTYFPPISTSQPWDTISPLSLGWCPDKIDTLYNYLQSENSKGFIVLKDGKIVLEKYFGTFTKDSFWYWASAGKTITSFLIGQAQEEGLLNIHDKSKQYLGSGWTNCTSLQEDSITILNQLTMTTGLDDGVPDNHCTLDTCLNYLAPVNTRWAYHNAPYTLLEQVIANASGQAINPFTQQHLLNHTGMNGFWYSPSFDNVFYSHVRSMARFGLLIQNNGIWDGDTLMHDTTYKNHMHSTSQNLNISYGYLWWLNGKSSFMVPGSQLVIPGSYAPNAPNDLYAGIGKNGQIVSIVPSKGIVMVRMGEAPSSSTLEVPFLLCNEIWKRLNDVMCNSVGINDIALSNQELIISPNPSTNEIRINKFQGNTGWVEITDVSGRVIYKHNIEEKIDISTFPKGMYTISFHQDKTTLYGKFIKQ